MLSLKLLLLYKINSKQHAEILTPPLPVNRILLRLASRTLCT